MRHVPRQWRQPNEGQKISQGQGISFEVFGTANGKDHIFFEDVDCPPLVPSLHKCCANQALLPPGPAGNPPSSLARNSL